MVGDMPSTRMVRCYSEGDGDRWEAVCLDFDLAVQGQSFEEVYRDLLKAIAEYVEYVSTLPQPDRARLLNRQAPLTMRLRFLWYALVMSIGGRQNGGEARKQRGEFLLPAAA